MVSLYGLEGLGFRVKGLGFRVYGTIGAYIVTNFLVPDSIYDYCTWYLKWTLNNMGSYLGFCSRSLWLHEPLSIPRACGSFSGIVIVNPMLQPSQRQQPR